MSCPFCMIAQGEIETGKIYEDKDMVVINDVNPQAPIHVLVIPKKHIESLLFAGQDDIEMFGKMLIVASNVAKQLLIDKTGYRIVINTNRDAGQSVDHLHIHMLGGRPMKWPPG
ncbi:MAG: histidine triad nucleotide-binding protein [Candidatus Omnitrophica bacterium]|nr:histidine triad nucleotide-binding protein [Candidatus Omnitrophota bacterium]